MRRRRLALVALGLAAAQDPTVAPTTAAFPPADHGRPAAAPTTAAPSAAPTTAARVGRADHARADHGRAVGTPEPSAAPTITLKPTLQPTDKPTWELHASRGWRSGVLDILAKDEMHIAYTSNPMQSSAQCLHGNEMYLPRACSATASACWTAPPSRRRRAARARRRRPRSAPGPGTARARTSASSRSEPRARPGLRRGLDRRCTTIWGCANHSMCFPTEDAAAGMHIDFRKEDLAQAAVRRPAGPPGSLGQRPHGAALRGALRSDDAAARTTVTSQWASTCR